MSGSTPQTVIHTPFDTWQSREFESKDRKPCTRIPKKETPTVNFQKKTSTLIERKRKTDNARVHGQHNTFDADRKMMI